MAKAFTSKFDIPCSIFCGFIDQKWPNLEPSPIFPLSRGGSSEEDNLWLSCRRCNEHKGAQIDGVDPEAGARAPLFNPRNQSWHEHFAWSGNGALIIGLTPTGRATVAALKLNNDDIVGARLLWLSVGWHPSEG